MKQCFLHYFSPKNLKFLNFFSKIAIFFFSSKFSESEIGINKTMNDINESNGGCEEVKETPICWICHGGCEDEKLISPCLCRGSMGYVHLTCLNQWRNANKNMDYFRCRICLFKYRLRQKTYLKFIKLNCKLFFKFS